MADKKISELPSITGANVDDANDTIAIVDSSAGQTKKITRGELFKGVDGAEFTSDTFDDFKVSRNTNQYLALWGDASGNVISSVAGSGNPKSFIFNAVEHPTDRAYVFRSNGTEVAAIEPAGDTLNSEVSVVTKEKGDVRYVRSAVGTSLADMNDVQNVSGFIYADGSGLNKPTNVTNFLGIQSKRNDTITWQFGVERNPQSNPNELWSRVETSGGVFTDWQKVLREVDGDALYLPERGSNANGEYVRFPDGTQICTHSLTTSSSGAVTWTFPAAFIAAPDSVHSNGNAASAGRFVTYASPTTTSTDVHGWSDATTRSTTNVSITAIGLWF